MKVFVISDTHFPFHNQKAYKKMMGIMVKEQPTHVVQIGDLLDQYVFSKYSRSLSVEPKQEIKRGLNTAAKMWKDVRALKSRPKCYQLLGNHDMRVVKRIMEKLPELEMLLDNGIYNFKGVNVEESDRAYIVLDGVTYCHGWFSKSADHIRHFGGPVVHGHLHKPSISTEGPSLWSMDVGYLADRNSLPLSYTQSKMSKWTLACGIVEDGKPSLILLE